MRAGILRSRLVEVCMRHSRLLEVGRRRCMGPEGMMRRMRRLHLSLTEAVVGIIRLIDREEEEERASRGRSIPHSLSRLIRTLRIIREKTLCILDRLRSQPHHTRLRRVVVLRVRRIWRRRRMRWGVWWARRG